MPRSEVIQTLARRRAVVPRAAWRLPDRLAALVLLPLVPLMWLYPLQVADVADTQLLGNVWSGDLSVSATLLSLLRLLVLVFAGVCVVWRRSASWWARGPLLLIAYGLTGNWARDRMYDTPLTLSFLLLLIGLAALTWRVLSQETAAERSRATEAENVRLRVENARLLAENVRLWGGEVITAELLQRLGYRGMPLAVAQAWATALNAAATRYQINTPLRLSHWLAQILHESGGLYYTKELWGPTPAQRGYEGRVNLGNTQPGDGKRYMGRGPIQVTGRANYRSAGQRLGFDLEGNPELAERPDIGALIAGDYWNSRGLNSRADRGGESMVETVSAAVNGRNRQGVPNHLPERLARFRQVWAILGAAPVQRFVLVDKGGKQGEWNGRDNPYNTVTLGPELLAALDLAYPVAGGPWEYGGLLKIWRRQSGVFVLERLPKRT